MKVLILILATVLVLLFLIQEGKTEGFLNSNQIYKNMKERGPEKALTIITGVCSIVFIVLSLLEAVV